MRYALACYQEKQDKFAYRIYVSDMLRALSTIVYSQDPPARYYDIIRPDHVETETVMTEEDAEKEADAIKKHIQEGLSRL